jgi:hypothetical protein
MERGRIVAIFQHAARDWGSIVRVAPFDRIGDMADLPAMPWATALTPSSVASAVVVLLASGLAALVLRRSQLAGTTLVAVWVWSTASLLTIGLVELSIAVASAQTLHSWVMPLRLAAATSSFCPTMALLGAKRPQDRGWQFIVVALWGILSLPSLHWLLFGGVREIHPAQLGFFAILVGVGLINGAGTRFWPANVLYGAGQGALLAPFFWVTSPWFVGALGPLVGLALIVASWWLLTAHLRRARPAAVPLDRVWIDFRDAFGAVWGLRVMERINASATMYGWPVGLTWNGFAPRGDVADDAPDVIEVPPAVEESLRTLLRRFVSPEWIDRRLAINERKDTQHVIVG